MTPIFLAVKKNCVPLFHGRYEKRVAYYQAFRYFDIRPDVSLDICVYCNLLVFFIFHNRNCVKTTGARWTGGDAAGHAS